MSQALKIVETIDLPANVIFEKLSDHELLGRALGVPIRRTRCGEDEPNGIGSVRTMGPHPIDFDETITAFDRPHRIDYRITRGSPVKNHQASIVFSPIGDSTEVTWTISFDAKPMLLAHTIKHAMNIGLRLGLRRLAAA